MKKLNEMILKEDFNSFIEWAWKTIENKRNKIDDYLSSTKESLTRMIDNKEKYNDDLKRLYDITLNVNEINAKSAIELFLKIGGGEYKLKYFIKEIEYYIKLLGMNPKQYGIDIIKINRHNQFKRSYDFSMYIRDSFRKILDAKDLATIKNKTRKSKHKEKRMADEFLYEDKDVFISLFTNYKTAKINFNGITNWCVTKNPEHWNYYNRGGFLVLFRNKSIKFISSNSTPDAFYCNNYKIEDGESIGDGITYDMLDEDISHPNFTTKYHDIVEKKCLEIFNGNFRNDDIIKFEEDVDSDSIFSNALEYLIDGERVVANYSVNITSPNHYEFQDGYGDDILENELGYEKMSGAEFYDGLVIKDIILTKDNFPIIGFINEYLEIVNVSGLFTIKDNDISRIYMDKDNGKETGIYFLTKLNLDFLNIDIEDDNSDLIISSKNSMEIQQIIVNNADVWTIETNEDTEIRFHKDIFYINGNKKGNVLLNISSFPMMTEINNFKKVFLYPFDVNVFEYGLVIGYGTEEIIFSILDNEDKDIIEDYIRKGYIDLPDKIKISYEEN